jgi:hypothetical protein
MDLPEKPIGFTRRMTMHLNWGGGKGAGMFAIFDAAGKKMPFGYQYDTQKDGLTGFTIAGITDRVFTWAEIRAHFAKESDDAGQSSKATSEPEAARSNVRSRSRQGQHRDPAGRGPGEDRG